MNNLWHDEFKVIEKEVERINAYKSTLAIEPEFKGRRDKFLDKMKQIFKGSGISETNYQKICDKYKDFVENLQGHGANEQPAQSKSNGGVQ